MSFLETKVVCKWGTLTASVSRSRKTAANNGRLMSPPNKCLLAVECIWQPCVTKERKKAGILFYKDRTQTPPLATEAYNSWCHPGQSKEPFTWSTKLTMALHPPMYAQHVTSAIHVCGQRYTRDFAQFPELPVSKYSQARVLLDCISDLKLPSAVEDSILQNY